MRKETIMLLNQFRAYYPQGSLISELVQFKGGDYVVKVFLQVDGMTLGTGLGAARTVEEAEDRARQRALALLGLEFNSSVSLDVQSNKNGMNQQDIISPISPIKEEKSTVSKETIESDRTVSKYELEEKSTPLSSSPVINSSIIETAPEELKQVSSVQKEAVKKVSTPPLTEVSPTVATLDNKPSEKLEKITTDENPVSDVSPSTPPLEEAPPPSKKRKAPSEPIDFSAVIAETNIELKRLNWTSDQGKEYLLQTYGKRSRQLLSDEELLEFLDYLKSQ